MLIQLIFFLNIQKMLLQLYSYVKIFISKILMLPILKLMDLFYHNQLEILNEHQYIFSFQYHLCQLKKKINEFYRKVELIQVKLTPQFLYLNIYLYYPKNKSNLSNITYLLIILDLNLILITFLYLNDYFKMVVYYIFLIINIFISNNK